MRTTLKRGIGRGHAANGNGKLQLPPGPLDPVTIYRQPEPPPRSRTSLVLRVLGWAALVLAVCVSGTAGGFYLWAHESVAAVAAKSPDVRKSIKRLDLPIAGQPATALVIGYDRRANEAKGAPSRSDTLMLIRADPRTKTISLLSFPRDLQGRDPVPRQIAAGRQDQRRVHVLRRAGDAADGEEGSRTSTINYLITVDFHGFKQIVDKLGGVWMDVDRRYLNTHSGPYRLRDDQPAAGLPAPRRLAGARLRPLPAHRLRPLPRRAPAVLRQGAEKSPSQISLLADEHRSSSRSSSRRSRSNIEVGQGGGKDVGARTVLSYAVLRVRPSPGHVFQSKIEGLEGSPNLTTSSDNIARAVQQWANPDVDSPKKATAVALGEKVKTKAPPATQTTVTVLNGNGVTGSASNASYLLGQRGYQILTPPDGIPANAPSFAYFRSKVYYDPSQAAKLAAKKLASLFGSADVARLNTRIRPLANGAMLTAVVGQTFHGTLAAAPIDQTPKREPANVIPGTSASLDLLREQQRKVDFPLMVPTVLERSSWIDRERPIRLYRFDEKGKHKTIRLTYRTGSHNDYWGVQETDWEDAPVLGSRNFVRNIAGRRYELYYNGPHLHMVVLRRRPRDLLGRQHPARPALERDDARDRQGPEARLESEGVEQLEPAPSPGDARYAPPS